MYKFLDASGATTHNRMVTRYNLPTCHLRPENEFRMWGAALTEHPNPAEPDGEPCGPGRLHIMKRLDARYAPRHWCVWWAVPAGMLVGQNEEKITATAVWLRPISPRELAWRLRRGEGRQADLREADLAGAYLRGADLTRAYLSGADLSGANLLRAYLRGADLSGADLAGAYLREAYLTGADLREADLSGADLSGAYLTGADLRGADLTGARMPE